MSTRGRTRGGLFFGLAAVVSTFVACGGGDGGTTSNPPAAGGSSGSAGAVGGAGKSAAGSGGAASSGHSAAGAAGVSNGGNAGHKTTAGTGGSITAGSSSGGGTTGGGHAGAAGSTTAGSGGVATVGGSSGAAGSAVAGSGGKNGCESDADCLAKLGQTLPESCAKATCDVTAGTCSFAAVDGDGDGYATSHCVSTSGLPIVVGKDCDDNSATTHPTAWDGPASGTFPDACDGVDEDCDGIADDGIDPTTKASCTCKPGDAKACGATEAGTPIVYPPLDPQQQPYGACAFGSETCGPDGTFGACIGAVGPSAEKCNSIDDDCNGIVDDPDEAADAETWYYDADNDGHGASAFPGVKSCGVPTDPPAGCDAAYCGAKALADCCPPGAYKADIADDDCNDENVSVHVVAPEICGNVIDYNCSGGQDEDTPTTVGQTTYFYDGDGDGYGDPAVPFVKSCAPPTAANSCVTCDPSKYIAASMLSGVTDCNDANAMVNPGATEVCDAAFVDENCNGTANEGCACVDGTKQDCGTLATCNFVKNGSTCTGGAFSACPAPAAKTTFCSDADNDKYCALSTCASYCPAGTPATQGPAAPAKFIAESACIGAASGQNDCDDTTGAVHPGATELCGDNVDSDCDGADNDGYSYGTTCDVNAISFGACHSGGAVACTSPGSTSTTCDESGTTTPIPTTTCQAATAPNGSYDWNCDGHLTACTNVCSGKLGMCTCKPTTPTLGTYKTNTGLTSCSGGLETYTADPTSYATAWTSGTIMPAFISCGGVGPTCSIFTPLGQTACTGAHLYTASCATCGTLTCSSGGGKTVSCTSPCGQALAGINCTWNGSTCASAGAVVFQNTCGGTGSTLGCD